MIRRIQGLVLDQNSANYRLLRIDLRLKDFALRIRKSFGQGLS